VSSLSEPDRINNVGCIEESVVGNDSIDLRGWVGSTGPESIDRLSVAFDGEAQPDAQIQIDLPSPDVEAVHPRLIGCGRARFTIRLPGVDTSPADVEDRLIVVTPWAGDVPGRPLCHVVAPTVPDPPQRYLDLVGGGMNIGCELLAHLIDLAELRPNESVLDVGCGTGRVAYALRCYLDEGTRYEGFDIVRELVDWADSEIASRTPGFRFTHADVTNEFYNPTGPISPAEFRFPYSDGEFDVVFLTSVFTHMRQPEIERYLDEIWRVLKPGGRCLASCFLLDEESGPSQAAGKGAFKLFHPVGGGWSSSVDVPERAIGFESDDFLRWASLRGFKLRKAYPGWWSGRFPYLSYQDLLILDRP